jgi:hypothetical protein
MAKENEPFSQDAQKLAQSTLNQVRSSYEKLSETSEKLFDAFQAVLPPDAQDINRKVFSYAQNNINEMFDLAQKIIQASGPEEVMKLQSTYLADQTQVIQKQATDLTSTIQKTISNSLSGASKPKT